MLKQSLMMKDSVGKGVAVTAPHLDQKSKSTSKLAHRWSMRNTSKGCFCKTFNVEGISAHCFGKPSWIQSY